MGQKVNPHGLRVGVIKDWDSRLLVQGHGEVVMTTWQRVCFLH